MTEIKLDEINKICEMHGLKKLSMSKNPCWIDKTNTEGVEILNEKVESFWVRNFERISGEIPSEKIQKVLDTINGNNKGKTEIVEGEKEGEKEEQNDNAMTAVMPEMLTSKMLEKFKFEDVFLNAQRTAKNHIMHRPGRGGKEISYVEGWYIKQVLNLATKWAWSSKIDNIFHTDTEVICIGSVEITLPDGSKSVQSAVGQADIKFKKNTTIPVCLGDDYKAAVTDMKKKAASEWGIASDVYRGDV